MGTKDKPANPEHQARARDCLARWYAQPQGQRVRERLLDRMRRHATGSPLNVAVELAPAPLMDPDAPDQARVLRVADPGAQVRIDPEAWALESAGARIIVLGHPCSWSPEPQVVVNEAARVLEPEGHLFMLEANRLHGDPEAGLRPSPLPEGLRSVRYRGMLAAAGLEVLEQWNLSVLPPGLPVAWQRRLARLDRWALRGLPPLAGVILTIAHKRVEEPLRPARALRFAPPTGAPGAAVSRVSCAGERGRTRDGNE